MDRSLYVAMTGATQILRAQTEVSHNLANASTTGFKAELSAFHALPVLGDGGPITLPPASHIDVGADGTVSVVPLGQTPDTLVNVGRIRLVNPQLDQRSRAATD
jgi:flagellar basal body rod protein FlgF